MADMRKQLSYTAAEIDERLGAVPDKVDKVEGKGLSTEDYTTAEKTKLAGLSNYDDTGIKAAIAKVIDDGSKNTFTTSTPSSNRATYTENNGVISVEGTGTWARVMFKVKCIVGQNVLALTVDSVSSSACRVAVAKNADATGQLSYETVTAAGNVVIPFTTDTADVYVVLYVNNSSTQVNTSLTVSNVMLCTKAEWDISQSYKPYAPSNRELYEMILAISPSASLQSFSPTAQLTDIEDPDDMR